MTQQTDSLFDGPADADDTTRDKRLSRQIVRVYEALASADMDARWLTLDQLADVCDAPPASVSARIRDLRKPRFGTHLIERRLLNDTGLYGYRLRTPFGDPALVYDPQPEPRSRKGEVRKLIEAYIRNARNAGLPDSAVVLSSHGAFVRLADLEEIIR